MFAARTASALLMVLATSGPVPAAPLAPGRNVDEELKFMPGETNLVVIIQMEKALETDAFKKLRAEIPMFDKEFEKSFRHEYGLDIANVERMVFGGDVHSSRPVSVVYSKSPVQAATITKTLMEPRFEGDKGRTYKEEKVGTHTLYVPDNDFDVGFVIRNDKTIVYGTAKSLKPTLEGQKAPERNAGLVAALKEADPQAFLALAMDVKAVMSKGKPPMIPGVDFDKVVNSVTGASLTLKAGKELSVRGIAVCTDAAAANEAKTQAEAFRAFIAEQAKNAPANAVPKDIVELPGKVKLTTRGNLGEASLTVKPEDVVHFIKAWFVPVQRPGAINPPVAVPAKPIQIKP